MCNDFSWNWKDIITLSDTSKSKWMADINSHITNLKKNSPLRLRNVQYIDFLEEVCQEVEERERRKNVIIFGIPSNLLKMQLILRISITIQLGSILCTGLGRFDAAIGLVRRIRVTLNDSSE